MKELKNLTGAKMLSKMEQKSVKGGSPKICRTDEDCCIGCICVEQHCIDPDV